jgi:diguanylate cyclase (GGDEF)-like protein
MYSIKRANRYILVPEASTHTQMDILSNFFTKIGNSLENDHRNASLAWGCCLFLAIAYLDYKISPSISLAVFYLFPISFFTWFVSKEAGFITCGLSAIAAFITKFSGEYTGSSFLASFWNASVMLIVFLTVSSLLFKLRYVLKQEQEFARIDSTTGVANKQLLFELARLEVKKSNRYRHPLTAIYLDIDDFKAINKAFGQKVGDRILHTAAQTLTDNLRETDIIGRIGKDEFVILLPGSGYEPARTVINRVQNQLLLAMEKHQWQVTFSIGAVTFINPPASVEAMIQQADHLMYLVKNNGKNHLKHKASL